ncbi:hypothetical protein [Pedobacter sp. MW01-1-1]|uniref:hypothetical protein n=1 Tax=Pedobacter sp. MW01-1-1 TaxID=3383027 RepID=UPI003FF05E39
MKFKNLTLLSVAVICLYACKKENPIVEKQVVLEQKDPLEELSDSLSFILEGKQLVFKKSDSKSNAIGNAVSNVKLDSLVKQKEYTSGDKDSVMFYLSFPLFDERGNSVHISFLKKYNLNQAQPKTTQTSLFVPLDKLDLFSVGERKFAMDFTRNNSQNGVTINLKGEYRNLQTYGFPSLVYHQLLKPELQSQSKFEVTNFQKLNSGKYLLEAKFNASVYFGDGSNIKKIESGYLRVKVNPNNLYF